MTTNEISEDLKSRGEKDVQFLDDGRIKSKHGKHTYNYWIVVDEELKYIDCKTIY
jgi:hypothetical protein